MRWDIENACADIVAAYLKAKVCQATQDASPIVTFYDPMSVDEANRIVVTVPDVATENYSVGNGVAMVEIGIKTKWKQKTVAATDFKFHFSRSNEVRDSLASATIVADMNTLNTAGIMANFVKPQRSFHTKVVDQWIYSETSFQLMYYLTVNP